MTAFPASALCLGVLELKGNSRSFHPYPHLRAVRKEVGRASTPSQGEPLPTEASQEPAGQLGASTNWACLQKLVTVSIICPFSQSPISICDDAGLLAVVFSSPVKVMFGASLMWPGHLSLSSLLWQNTLQTLGDLFWLRVWGYGLSSWERLGGLNQFFFFFFLLSLGNTNTHSQWNSSVQFQDGYSLSHNSLEMPPVTYPEMCLLDRSKFNQVDSQVWPYGYCLSQRFTWWQVGPQYNQNWEVVVPSKGGA